MFELDKYDSGLHQETPAAPAEKYKAADDIKEMSFLGDWRKHGGPNFAGPVMA